MGMPGHAANEKLVSLLIGDEWSKRTRNTAARIIAEGQAEDGLVSVDHVVNDHYSRYARNRTALFVLIAEAVGCATITSTESYEYQGKRLRYHVRLVGHSSDVRRAEELYSLLASTILGRIVQIDADPLHKRRSAFHEFNRMVEARLHEVITLPSCAWVPVHRSEAQHQGAA